MISIINNGQLISETNYWQTEHARRGFFFLSWNAGAARLLVPGAQRALIRETAGTEYVIISRGNLQGRDALEIMFEDHSDSPYAIHMVAEQCDRLFPAEGDGVVFPLTLWTEAGLQGTYTARYRESGSLPDLSPWSSH